MTVMIQIHQLWSKTHASASGDAAIRAAFLEWLALFKFRIRTGSDIPVNAQQALAKLSHQQVREAVAVPVRHERRRMPDFGIDGLAGSQNPDSGLKILRWRSRQRRPEPGRKGWIACSTPNPAASRK